LIFFFENFDFKTSNNFVLFYSKSLVKFEALKSTDALLYARRTAYPNPQIHSLGERHGMSGAGSAAATAAG
jgi:hypothetical protein